MSEPTTLEARRTYLGLAESFELARTAHPGLMVEASYHLAGRPVQVRFVGRRLAQAIDRPFTHLRSSSRFDVSPALRIDLWDQEETGVGCEGCDPNADPVANGQVLSSEDGRFVIHARPRTRTGMDRKESRLVGWASSVEELSLYELGRPLHAQLLLWLSQWRVQPVHAGLVARHGQGILFGGPGGAGKTTTAIACLQAGWEYLADDYVGLEVQESGKFVGHSLYVSTHLDPEHLTRFPGLLPHARAGQLAVEHKSLVLLPDAYPGRYLREATILAVALPLVTRGPRTTWRSARKVETLLRLAPSSLFMLPHVGGERGFAVVSSLAEQVPTFWLELGPDLGEIPARVAEILDAALEAAPSAGEDRNP